MARGLDRTLRHLRHSVREIGDRTHTKCLRSGADSRQPCVICVTCVTESSKSVIERTPKCTFSRADSTRLCVLPIENAHDRRIIDEAHMRL
jgi:hypothetical protein